jgi:hypothetical protein
MDEVRSAPPWDPTEKGLDVDYPLSQQLGYMSRPRGHVISPHVHNRFAGIHRSLVGIAK